MKLFNFFEKKNAKFINQIVMAPMTRARNPDGILNSLNAEYYSQRSGKTGAGLIVTEGIIISPTSTGYLYVPGIYTDQMIEGAKMVTKAVHEKGSKIFCQIWHVGRSSHVSTLPINENPVGVSDQRAQTMVFGLDESGKPGFVEASKPVALTTNQIKEIIKDFANAAKNAISAGFDGVELHGANGYLIEQFLNPMINNRTDEYGGTIEKRSRFLLEVVDACIAEIGSDKVAVRISPFGLIGDMPAFDETEVKDTYKFIAEELDNREVVYIHIMNQSVGGKYVMPHHFMEEFRSWYNGIIILAGGLDKKKAMELIDTGIIDMAAFGDLFVSNPDLAERMENNWELSPSRKELYFGGNKEGYTDYKPYQKE
ncbi:2,4-dienoyl-CoA reductase [Chryseobacterium oleae]|uniref:2,4-dienoyl-CoA reductase n=1 Tax=Chryseobacterium oleae TaxID=491207 RepID=A0A1I4YSR7_CHROL|nr:alkene reductase [Chryseobacterium oleae]SFN40813.1 2,4-dienoyl-CoA reductase [Chryseobacterium oleae]